MILDEKKLKEIKDAFQDGNINFLIGSGASVPYLKTLKNIEKLLESLDNEQDKLDKHTILRVSIYKRFFDVVIKKNINLLEDDTAADDTVAAYRGFLETLNYLMLRRKSTILDKQVNLFTTNIDLFFEKSLDSSDLEYSDGFSGRFKPKFSLSNFKKTQHKKSLQYDNKSEIPIFNLLKIHGSLTWRLENTEQIYFSHDLQKVRELLEIEIDEKNIIPIRDEAKYSDLIKEATKVKVPDPSLLAFKAAYEELNIVNPDKNKFQKSILNENYYELLRIYTNELEKENTLLFVFGFSFADEHIQHVTARTANANPTLTIYVFAHSNDAAKEIEKNIKLAEIKNNNVKIIAPELEDPDNPKSDKYKYDLKTFNEMVFKELLVEDDDKTITIKLKSGEISETKD